MSALSGFINYSSGDSEISDEEDDYTSKLVKSPPSGLGKYKCNALDVMYPRLDVLKSTHKFWVVSHSRT